MRASHYLFLLVFASIVLCVLAPASSACSNPPIRTITFTWTPGTLVSIVPNNVPNGSVSTAYGNWNSGMLQLCDSPQFSEAGITAPIIKMSYAPLAPPSSCPSGSTCYTRGMTDLTNATFTSAHRLSTVSITINSAITATAAITEVVAHELGHTLGLLDCNYPGCPIGSSVMESQAPLTSINGIIGQPGPTACDVATVLSVAPDYGCNSSSGGCDPNCPLPQPPPQSMLRGRAAKLLKVQSGAVCCSPILVDTTGKGFLLTNPQNGVMFDITGTGNPIRLAWTAANSGDAFLALPGADGLVHNGHQLFGSSSPQPPSATPNGFAALAVYDDPESGGNGDGIVDASDAIWPSLRLWIDANHDGICQIEEMHTLTSLGVNSISLNYREDRRVDRFGNLFRYRAMVNPDDPAAEHVGNLAYDVFFLVAPGQQLADNVKKCIALK